MRQLRATLLRLRGLFASRAADADFTSELEAHIALHTDEGIRAGLSATEARRQALLRLGGAEQTRQAHRERRTLPRLDALLRDAHYALRQLRKSPAFTVTAVLTLALAIGANTAIFTLVNAILLRQLPFDQPSRVLTVENAYTVGFKGDRNDASSPTASASFSAAARSFKSIESAAIYANSGVNVSIGAGSAQRLKATETSAQFLDVLGVVPRLGRGFRDGDDLPGNDRVALIGDGLWRSTMNADPHVLGRSINLNGLAFTVIGVLPPQMDFPEKTDVWTPTVFDQHVALREGGAYFTFVLVRSRASASIDALRAEFNARFEANMKHDAAVDSSTPRPVLTPIADELTKSIRGSLLMLTVAVAFVLLIACVNVASLALIRTAERRAEFAVRAALGAARGRLMQQQLVESTFIAMVGGALGVLFALGGLQTLYVLRPAALADFQSPAIDPAVLAFSAIITLATGLVFGIAPAWLAGRGDPAGAIKTGVTRTAGQGTRFRKALVACQVSAAFVLLAGAGLMLRTLSNMNRVPLGYDVEGRLSFSIALHGPPYIVKEESTPAVRAFYADLLDRLARIPGVTAAAAVSDLPLDSKTEMLLSVSTGGPNRIMAAAAPKIASSGYLASMGIPILAGRDFSSRDTSHSPVAVIVGKTLADKLWPGENPLGKNIHCFFFCKDAAIVVGVVAANRGFGPRHEATEEYYIPYTQADWDSMTIVLRSNEDLASLVPAVRRVVAAVDPAQPIFDLETMRKRLNDNESLMRFEIFVLCIFSAISVVLVAIGLYGVVSYSVTSRTREIGIRIAIGAPRSAIVFAILCESAFISFSGIGTGMGLALLLTRLLQSALFGVTPHDPATFGGVALLFFILAAVASWLPARRAATIDPVNALRSE